jgi:hypothetical protein
MTDQPARSAAGAKEKAMYQIHVYAITESLWRWEIRCGGALLYCGTAPSRYAAESEARDAVTIA